MHRMFDKFPDCVLGFLFSEENISNSLWKQVNNNRHNNILLWTGVYLEKEECAVSKWVHTHVHMCYSHIINDSQELLSRRTLKVQMTSTVTCDVADPLKRSIEITAVCRGAARCS